MAEFTVERSAEVNATPQEIWEQLMDVASWPEWKPFMKKAGIGGGYETLGCGAKVKMGLMVGGPASVPITATVTDFRKPELLSWEGGAKGVFHAVHSFEIKDRGGKSLVISREHFTGFLLPVVQLLVTQQDLEKLHEQWVAAIKERMEGQPDEPEDHGHGH